MGTAPGKGGGSSTGGGSNAARTVSNTETVSAALRPLFSLGPANETQRAGSPEGPAHGQLLAQPEFWHPPGHSPSAACEVASSWLEERPPGCCSSSSGGAVCPGGSVPCPGWKQVDVSHAAQSSPWALLAPEGQERGQREWCLGLHQVQLLICWGHDPCCFLRFGDGPDVGDRPWEAVGLGAATGLPSRPPASWSLSRPSRQRASPLHRSTGTGLRRRTNSTAWSWREASSSWTSRS